MEKLLILGLVLMAWFGGAFAEYVIGRVALPAMGLTAPGYWTWFWVTFWVLAFTLPFTMLREALK